MANVRPSLDDEQPTYSITAPGAPGGGNMAVNHTPPYSEDLPCEKYRQFMDSSVQERTFMIEKLVDTFANVIDSIWHPKFLIEHQQVKVMPTRGFCNEILKRSKATYSTLQISLFYIFRVKKVVHEKLYQRIQQSKQQQQQQQQLKADMQTSIVTNQMDDLMCCGRRMFLASLMVASKYLHDKNYHNKAWAKITGLDIKEINAAEMAFLNLIDYRLYVSKPTFDRWYTQIHGHIQKSYKSTPLNKSPLLINGKDNANILPLSSHSARLSLAQQQQQARMMQQHQSDYPSPPPDENTNHSHPLAPPSPSSNTTATTADKCTSFQRTDSGVSFDVFSSTKPTNITSTTTTTYSIINSTATPIGAKRQCTSEEQDMASKRLCQ